MGRSAWAALAAIGSLAVAGHAAALTLGSCASGCVTDAGSLFNVDYTVPADGRTYRWELWTDTPGVLITLSSPNETFDADTVSNGDGTFHSDAFLLGAGFDWDETEAPSHTTIFTRTLMSNFDHCGPTSPAGEICAAQFNVWGNGAFVSTDSREDIKIFFSSVAVPEPATWALMIGGFFGLGAALRRGRAVALA